jgi:hypothetical protein
MKSKCVARVGFMPEAAISENHISHLDLHDA